MMKAAIYRKYGPPEVLRIEEVEMPSLVGEPERVLVRVHSASVNPFDVWHRKGYLPVRLSNGLFTPKKTLRLGVDVAGVVEAVGQGVERFKPGDVVFGSCLGSHAEYVRPKQGWLARMPDNLTFNEAAAIPCAALTALQALRDVAQVKEGQKVLVYGASGGIGHYAVQLARHLGAQVIAVCSTSNLDWVRELGAQRVIDYAREDFAASGQRYDLILDAVGKRTYSSCKPALAEGGVYISEHVLKPGGQIPQFLWSRAIGDKRFRVHLAEPNAADLELLADLAAEGVLKPVVEKVYPLEEIAAAHRHVEGGHTKGKVAVEVAWA